MVLKTRKKNSGDETGQSDSYSFKNLIGKAQYSDICVKNRLVNLDQICLNHDAGMKLNPALVVI